MAVIDDNPNTMYEKFLDRLVYFPYMRTALFAAIAAIVLYILGLPVISRLLFFVVLQAIIGRFLSVWMCGADHPLTKFWSSSLFVGIEVQLVATALRPFAENMGIVFLLIARIGPVAIFLAGIVFLIRIFFAIFNIE